MTRQMSLIFMTTMCLILNTLAINSGVEASSDVQELKRFQDWNVYQSHTDKGQICFISSEPKILKGEYDRNNRGSTRVFVSHGPDKADHNVISVIAGYRYKKQSDVDFVIDDKKTKLFTDNNRAWSSGTEDDQRLVSEMKRGKKLVVIGISSRNNRTIDEYSLLGFTKAKDFLDKLCP